MSSSIVHFTAAEIGQCLVCTAQNARKALGVRANAKKVIRGVEAAAWRYDSIPSSVIARLATLAPRHGHVTPLQYLQNSFRPERALPSAARVADDEIERAQKLQRALSVSLSSPNLSTAERARIARDDFNREFGRVVSERHLRRLLDRVLKLDQGHQKFDRLNLYFSERPAAKIVRPRSFHFDELDSVFKTILDRTKPTLQEIAHCWREVLKLWFDRLATGADEVKLKRELCHYLLQAAPFMGDSEYALKHNLNRKIREALEHGIETIADGRVQPQSRSRQRAKDFPEDLNLLSDYSAKFCYGRDSQAWRELHTGTTPIAANGARLSEEMRARWPFDPRRAKSQMPNQVRLAIAARRKRKLAQIRGSRAIQKLCPTGLLDWNGVSSGDYYSADDVTGNHQIIEFRGKGKFECEHGRFDCGRPQFLLTIDERSGFVLGFTVRLAKRYERMMIIQGAASVCLDERIGLPFKGWVLESGPWAANDVTASLVGWAQYDSAFQEEGISLEIVRARTPQGKARIENTIGRIQSFFDFGPGFCGRAEKSVRYQRVSSFVNSLKRFDQPYKKPVDPRRHLMTLQEYRVALDEAVSRYNNEPQNGEMLRDENLRGLSPREAWTHFASERTHHVLPISLAFLMAPGRALRKIDHNGITLTIGATKCRYLASSELAQFLDQRVQVRFFPDSPDHVFVAPIDDANGKRAFAVPISERIAARGASDEDFARRKGEEALFTDAGQTLHSVFAPPTNRTIRNNQLGSPELRSLGESFNRARAETAELSGQRTEARSEIQERASRNNLAIDPAKVRRPALVAKHLSAIDEIKARIRASESRAEEQL